MIFDSSKQLIKLFLAFVAILSTGFFMKHFLNDHPIVIIIVVIVTVMIMTIFSYKFFGLIKKSDIHRFFGTNNFLSNSLIRIYSK